MSTVTTQEVLDQATAIVKGYSIEVRPFHESMSVGEKQLKEFSELIPEYKKARHMVRTGVGVYEKTIETLQYRLKELDKAVLLLKKHKAILASPAATKKVNSILDDIQQSRNNASALSKDLTKLISDMKKSLNEGQ